MKYMPNYKKVLESGDKQKLEFLTQLLIAMDIQVEPQIYTSFPKEVQEFFIVAPKELEH